MKQDVSQLSTQLLYKRIVISLISQVPTDKKAQLINILFKDTLTLDEFFNYLVKNIPNYQNLIQKETADIIALIESIS